METIQLNSGRKLDSIGLGLWKIENEKTSSVVRTAIQMGYRHFDSACDYGNEIEAGQGIAEAIAGGDVCREESIIHRLVRVGCVFSSQCAAATSPLAGRFRRVVAASRPSRAAPRAPHLSTTTSSP